MKGQGSEYEVIPLEDGRLGEVVEKSTRGGNDGEQEGMHSMGFPRPPYGSLRLGIASNLWKQQQTHTWKQICTERQWVKFEQTSHITLRLQETWKNISWLGQMGHFKKIGHHNPHLLGERAEMHQSRNSSLPLYTLWFFLTPLSEHVYRIRQAGSEHVHRMRHQVSHPALEHTDKHMHAAAETTHKGLTAW